MGLDRNTKTPCGFAFVEYFLHEEAVDCMRYISGTKLDERVIRCDLDPGYKEGRQFGRGRSGGQVRDEFRQEYDSGRGELNCCSRYFKGTLMYNHRRLGPSTFGGREKEARTRQTTFANAVRHLCCCWWPWSRRRRRSSR